MTTVAVVYHVEDGHWWAESPTVPTLAVAGESLSEVRALVRESLPFYFGTDEIELLENHANGQPVASVQVIGSLECVGVWTSSYGGSVLRLNEPRPA